MRIKGVEAEEMQDQQREDFRMLLQHAIGSWNIAEGADNDVDDEDDDDEDVMNFDHSESYNSSDHSSDEEDETSDEEDSDEDSRRRLRRRRGMHEVGFRRYEDDASRAIWSDEDNDDANTFMDSEDLRFVLHQRMMLFETGRFLGLF